MTVRRGLKSTTDIVRASVRVPPRLGPAALVAAAGAVVAAAVAAGAAVLAAAGTWAGALVAVAAGVAGAAGAAQAASRPRLAVAAPPFSNVRRLSRDASVSSIDCWFFLLKRGRPRRLEWRPACP